MTCPIPVYSAFRIACQFALMIDKGQCLFPASFELIWLRKVLENVFIDSNIILYQIRFHNFLILSGIRFWLIYQKYVSIWKINWSSITLFSTDHLYIIQRSHWSSSIHSLVFFNFFTIFTLCSHFSYCANDKPVYTSDFLQSKHFVS